MAYEERYLEALRPWLPALERELYRCPDRPELVCYGTGYNGWGVQTHQKAFAAAAVLAASGSTEGKSGNRWGKVWLSDPSTAMTAVSLPLVWKYVGLMMIVIFAGLQSIPSETLEAAELDGASGFQKMTKIVIPMISGVLQVCFVLALTSAFKQFDFVLILTQGGPIHRPEVTGTYMYKMGFSDMRYGFGSAVAAAIMLITLLLMLVMRLVTGKGDKA